MRINAPEYLILLGIGVLNIWAALILASVRARSTEQSTPDIAVEPPRIEATARPGSEQRA